MFLWCIDIHFWSCCRLEVRETKIFRLSSKQMKVTWWEVSVQQHINKSDVTSKQPHLNKCSIWHNLHTIKILSLSWVTVLSIHRKITDCFNEVHITNMLHSPSISVWPVFLLSEQLDSRQFSHQMQWNPKASFGNRQVNGVKRLYYQKSNIFVTIWLKNYPRNFLNVGFCSICIQSFCKLFTFSCFGSSSSSVNYPNKLIIHWQ